MSESTATGESMAKELEERKVWLFGRRKRYQQMYYLDLVLGIMSVVGATLSYLLYTESKTYSLILLVYAFTFICFLPIFRARFKEADADIQEIDFETDLLRYSVSNGESRAEKLLRMNQKQLRRYYDLNLNQNVWVFGIGIFCILLGIAVVGATMYMVINQADKTGEKVIIGVIGSIGTLLINYVAAIYLKMHSAATSNLGEFHNRLVGTHQLLLGNLIASRIDDEDKRWSTLSDVATNIAKDNR